MQKQKVINTKIATLIVSCICLTTVMIVSANTLMGSKTSMKRYMVKSQYESSSDLAMTLLNNPNRLFAWCCDCIRYYAIEMGITYEQLNIHLFVIIQPMLILLFFILFVIQSLRISRFRDQKSLSRSQ